MTALRGNQEIENAENIELRRVIDPYLTKGIKQQAGVFYLVHVFGAIREPSDGGKRVHPDCLGGRTCENTAKCLCRP